MNPRLLHLYGPLWVNSYGTMIAIGLAVFLLLSYRHPLRKKYIDGDLFLNGVMICLLTGLVGGRILFVLLNLPSYLNNWVEIFYPWAGGFALLGGVLAVPPTMIWYLRHHRVEVLPVMDLAALYVPLLQAISRVGCFLAGCCFGCLAPEGFSWAITYTHPDSLAPLYVALHPTQLYSLGASLAIFFIVQGYYTLARPARGQIFFLYLILEGVARCMVDFWRGDVGQYAQQGLHFGLINAYQGIACALVLIGVCGFWYLSGRNKSN